MISTTVIAARVFQIQVVATANLHGYVGVTAAIK